MASQKAYLAFILEQLSQLPDVTYRPMMGEYLLYSGGRLFGGIYDDRLLVKPVAAAKAMLPDGVMETPYAGAKPMLLVEEADDPAFLAALIRAMEPELSAPKKRK